LLNRFLAASDAACPQCGYRLRAAPSGVCPECGHALRVALERRVALPPAWLALLVSTSLLAGTGLRRWVFMVGHGFPVLPPNSWHWMAMHLWVMASPLLLAAVLVWRGWLTRRHPALQWTLAALVALLTALEFWTLL
jgi:hypothetical protein